MINKNNVKYRGKERDVVYYKVNEKYLGADNQVAALANFVTLCIKTGALKINDKSNGNAGLSERKIV
jgi:hypothetical protein